MLPTKIIAIVLIVAGILGLAYGSFSFTTETHEAEIGGLSISVDEKKSVNVPIWLGAGLVVAGTALLLMRKS